MSLEPSTPLSVSNASECNWYHTFEFPDGTLVRGRWDYRKNVDDYLGKLNYKGKSVIEIGPASGYLTRAMEQRGADVFCVETCADNIWDVVPRLDRNTDEYIRSRKELMPRLWKSWWLTRKVFGGTAQIAYLGAASIDGLESSVRFDIGLVGSVLQHFANPYLILSQLAKRCDMIVVAEAYIPRLYLPGRNLIEFLPAANNNNLGSWWLLSATVVDQMMETLNFSKTKGYHSFFRRWDLKNTDPAKDSFQDRDFFIHVYKKKPRNEKKYNLLRET